MDSKARYQVVTTLREAAELLTGYALGSTDMTDLPKGIRAKVEKRLNLSPGQEPKWIGTGTKGKAYVLPNGKVLKITTDAAEADAMNIIRKKPSKFVVPVHDVFVVDLGGGASSKVFYIVMDQLSKPDPKWKELAEFLHGQDITVDNVKMYTTFLQSNADWMKSMKPVLNWVLGLAKDLEARNILWYDLHEGNVMRTKQGKHVAIDLGYSKAPKTAMESVAAKALRDAAQALVEGRGTNNNDIKWDTVKDEVKQFNDLLPKMRDLAAIDDEAVLREKLSRWAGLLRSFQDYGWPLGRDSVLQKWLTTNWPVLRDRTPLIDALYAMKDAVDILNTTLRMSSAPDLRDYVASLVKAMDKYAEEMSKLLKTAAPERFMYKGLRILNPHVLPDHVVKGLLKGVDYVLLLFKKRGMSVLLDKTLQEVELRHQQYDETAHGFYHPQLKRITLMSEALYSGGKMLKEWVTEVFLHEVGHHVHMTLMHPGGRKEWDSGWDPVVQIQKRTEVLRRVDYQDRLHFWDMLVKAKGNLKAIKLKGVDKMHFHAWLSQPSFNGPYVTPKQLKWSKQGEDVARFMKDPEGFYAGRYDPADIPDEVRDRWLRIKKNLWVLPEDSGREHPILKAEEVIKYMKLDNEIEKALNDLGVPTDYAKTNEMEDFAETFVAFMDAPEKLSDNARYRMQRALHHSGLYGKPIMKRIGAAARASSPRSQPS